MNLAELSELFSHVLLGRSQDVKHMMKLNRAVKPRLKSDCIMMYVLLVNSGIISFDCVCHAWCTLGLCVTCNAVLHYDEKCNLWFWKL